jgi:hypothetical protein
MDRAEFDTEQSDVAAEQEPVIDFAEDPIDVSDSVENDEPADAIYSDDPEHRIDNAELDNALDEFVDVVNGRDLDGLLELLASDVRADFLGEGSPEGVVAGFNDLFLRNPTLLVTRADLGYEPLTAVWAFDLEADRFDPMGYITLEVSEDEPGLIQRIEYIEELSDSDDLVVEAPERSDLPEWDEWSEVDED